MSPNGGREGFRPTSAVMILLVPWIQGCPAPICPRSALPGLGVGLAGAVVVSLVQAGERVVEIGLPVSREGIHVEP